MEELQPTFGFPQDKWDESKRIVTDALVVQLKSKGSQPLTYTEVFNLVKNLVPFRDPHDTRFHHMLGQVSEDEDDASKGLLTALVVHKDGSRRGLVETCGRERPQRQRQNEMLD